MTQPNSRKEIRQQARMEKAARKAARPWPLRHWILTGGGALVVLIIIIVVAGSGGGNGKDDSSMTADNQPLSTTTRTSSPATAKASTAPALTFPGQKSHDKAVKAGEQVKLSGWSTTAAPLTKVADDAFGPQLCTDVTMANRDTKAQSYYVYAWKLEAPSGDTKDIAISAHNNDWGNGSLAPNGTKSGTICFDDPGQSGKYVVLWQPDTFSSDARGAWLNTVS